MIDLQRRDVVRALEEAERSLRRAEEQLEKRDLWTTDSAWADAVAGTIQAGRQALWLLHHDRGWGWQFTTEEERVDAERLSASLDEAGAVAVAHGARLFEHDMLPGDLPPYMA